MSFNRVENDLKRPLCILKNRTDLLHRILNAKLIVNQKNDWSAIIISFCISRTSSNSNRGLQLKLDQEPHVYYEPRMKCADYV